MEVRACRLHSNYCHVPADNLTIVTSILFVSYSNISLEKVQNHTTHEREREREILQVKLTLAWNFAQSETITYSPNILCNDASKVLRYKTTTYCIKLVLQTYKMRNLNHIIISQSFNYIHMDLSCFHAHDHMDVNILVGWVPIVGILLCTKRSVISPQGLSPNIVNAET